MPGYELIGAEEQAEIDDIFKHGGVLFRHSFDHLRQDRWKVRDFEREFAKSVGMPHALAVTSGTAALRVALAVLDIKPGDEVITQSFTFVATVEAIIEAGAIPVCAEIDGTLNIDPESLKSLITPKTKAVIAVHMLGTPARLFEIDDICRKNNLTLIEDAAWGCGGSLDGRPLGTWGQMGTYSFDFAKIRACSATLTGSPTPLPGSGAKTGTPTLSPTTCNWVTAFGRCRSDATKSGVLP